MRPFAVNLRDRSPWVPRWLTLHQSPANTWSFHIPLLDAAMEIGVMVVDTPSKKSALPHEQWRPIRPETGR